MKIKKNWWLWSLVFICFLLVWTGRSSIIEYKLRTERLQIEMKHIPERESRQKSEAPPPPLKETVDIWGWVIKACAGLSGLKTLMDIIDKFKPKRVKQ